MPLDPPVLLRSAMTDDAAFIVQMTRHACVIEDWPLPDADSAEVVDMLPAGGVVPIVAVDGAGTRVGAVWTFHDDPPLLVDSAGVALPELCIGVTPGRRGNGIGGLLLDELFACLAGTVQALCTNVHARNPAQKLYQRKGFQVVGQGRGALGIAMLKELQGAH